MLFASTASPPPKVIIPRPILRAINNRSITADLHQFPIVADGVGRAVQFFEWIKPDLIVFPLVVVFWLVTDEPILIPMNRAAALQFIHNEADDLLAEMQPYRDSDRDSENDQTNRDILNGVKCVLR